MPVREKVAVKSSLVGFVYILRNFGSAHLKFGVFKDAVFVIMLSFRQSLY